MTMGELSASIAHEVKQPLAAIAATRSSASPGPARPGHMSLRGLPCAAGGEIEAIHGPHAGDISPAGRNVATWGERVVSPTRNLRGDGTRVATDSTNASRSE